MTEKRRCGLPAEARRRRGGQPGNQNARKHGFYSKMNDKAARLEFRQAARANSLEAEIALLRLKIKSLLETDSQNIRLLGQEVRLLSSILLAKHKMRPAEKPDSGEMPDSSGKNE